MPIMPYATGMLLGAFLLAVKQIDGLTYCVGLSVIAATAITHFIFRAMRRG